MHHQSKISVSTAGRGSYELTDQVLRVVRESGIEVGLCVVTCLHTSASLLVTECADPSVQVDLRSWLERLAPDGDSLYTHTAEGPDDMPSHLKAAITRSTETLSVAAGALVLGVWQGLFLLEHRARPHQREVFVHVTGVPAG